MKKFSSFLAALAVMAMPFASFAAINNVTVNGDVNDTVHPSSTITLNVDFDLVAGQQVESAKVEFPGSNVPAQRFDLKPDYTQPNHYNLNLSGVKVPADQYAVWHPVVTLCGDPTAGAANNCETGTEVMDFTMDGQVSTDGVASTSSSSSSSSDIFSLDFWTSLPTNVRTALLAWFMSGSTSTPTATPTPTPTPAPTVNPLCAQFSTYSYLHMGSYGAAGLQHFLIDHGYSIPAGATGFYGMQTSNAVAQFQGINHCN